MVPSKKGRAASSDKVTVDGLLCLEQLGLMAREEPSGQLELLLRLRHVVLGFVPLGLRSGQRSFSGLHPAEGFIALYRSLGGGWENYQSLPPIHRPQPAVIAMFQRLLSRSRPFE